MFFVLKGEKAVPVSGLPSKKCIFVTDLHGDMDRYTSMFRILAAEQPDALFMGGDLLPSGLLTATSIMSGFHKDFINDYLAVEFGRLKQDLGPSYPSVFLILGNDDARFEESSILSVATQGIWQYIHNRVIRWHGYDIYGYAYIPPTPFTLKDWERYDVSRYTDPGCTAPYQGTHTIPVSDSELKYATIQEDLNRLTSDRSLDNAVFLFHSPPYQTKLDRAALDGKMIDYVPLDVHVGSIAIKRFIEKRQPRLTLHGHVHESATLTGAWMDTINSTTMISAAHDGPELSLVRFDPRKPGSAARELM